MRLSDLSLGWQTEFSGHRLDARIDAHADCIAVCTEATPTFYWGTCLILPRAPADADLAHWLARFDQLIAAGRPAVRHVAIGIDAPRGDTVLPVWLAAGFHHHDPPALALRPGGAAPA